MIVRYVSTRGQSPTASFDDVLLGGPAPDGGLYLPEQWPQISRLPHRAYAHVAFSVMKAFAGDAFSDTELREDIDAAYAAFADPAVAPLVEIGRGRYLLELFHGPTLAFKDIALQLLGRLFARALAKRKACATVIVATSGDTGSAAIAAFRGAHNVDIVVLHPKGRVSEVQRRQMTTVADENVHNIALDGSFDDTQAIVKARFRRPRASHRGELDQFCAHRRAVRLLFHRRGGFRRTRRVRRTHREFRRCLRRRGGGAHGASRARARGRNEFKRHFGARAHDGLV